MESFLTFILLVFGISVRNTNANFRSGKATTLRLNDYNEIPVLGLGTAVGRGDPTSVQTAVEAAIDAGYRHIDTATYYRTEKYVGLGLKSKIRDGTVRRKDVFITTKLYNDRHEEHQVLPALQESLQQLDLDYVDLYLIHWPVSTFPNNTLSNIDYVETWRGMEEVQRLGLTRSIGVSNFNEAQLVRLMENCKVIPAVNQIEVNPNLTQKKLIDFCHRNNIQVVAYSPLGSMPEARSQNKTNLPPPSIDDPILKEIGDKYNKSTVQIVLRYLVDRGVIPIPKSVNPHRIQQNIHIFDFTLTPEEIEKIDGFNVNRRIIDPEFFKSSPYYPFGENN